MKSIDKAILGMVSEFSGCNESERIGGHRKAKHLSGTKLDVTAFSKTQPAASDAAGLRKIKLRPTHKLPKISSV
jgi:hypothetical protein